MLQQSGQEDLTSGYLGGILDAATGLIYLGNGQYYDPKIGRFLSRGVEPNQTNPFVPWQSDPAGAMIAPLALLAMIYGRKKKRDMWDKLVIVVVLCLVVGGPVRVPRNSNDNGRNTFSYGSSVHYANVDESD